MRRALKRSRSLLIGLMLFRNARAAAAERIRPNRSVKLGDTHTTFSTEQSLDYLSWVLGDYLTYGGLGGGAISGARVLELGPGDNLGVALALLAKGAERVVSLDRFVTWRDPEHQRRINAALLEGMSEDERGRIEDVIGSDGSLREGQERLGLIEGTPIEEAEGVLGAGGFKFVISRAVLEHVYDLDGAFAAMDKLVVPGGTMAHKVDLSDHDLFAEGGQNPLTFLTIPDWIYERMRRHTGFSNRVLADYYIEKLDGLGYSGDVLATNVIGWPEELQPTPLDGISEPLRVATPLIEEARPKLVEPYSALADRELAISGVFLRWHKPG